MARPPTQISQYAGLSESGSDVGIRRETANCLLVEVANLVGAICSGGEFYNWVIVFDESDIDFRYSRLQTSKEFH